MPESDLIKNRVIDPRVNRSSHIYNIGIKGAGKKALAQKKAKPFNFARKVSPK